MGRTTGLPQLLKRGLYLVQVPLTRIREPDANVAPLQ